MCWLMPSSGKIQLSTMKWFNKQDAIILEVKKTVEIYHVFMS
jgi:hypothetical protein